MKKLICTVCLTLILTCIPFAMAMAADGIYNNGERIYEPTTYFDVIYKASGGRESRICGCSSYVTTDPPTECYFIVGSGDPSIWWGFTKWSYTKISVTDDNGTHPRYILTAIEDEESEKSAEKKHHETKPGSWVDNPNEITAFYIVNGNIDPKARFGKQEQGEACKAAFATQLPAGWKQAFSFSMSYDGKHTTDLKDGTLQMYIPSGYQKSGRKYAVMGIDKYGKVHIFNDSDLIDYILTAKLDLEGYAFALIYMD